MPKAVHVRAYGKTKGKILLAAHRTLRPGSIILVESLPYRKKVVVQICGTGPARWTKRILDLATDAYTALAPLHDGHVTVRIALLYRARNGVHLSYAERVKYLRYLEGRP